MLSYDFKENNTSEKASNNSFFLQRSFIALSAMR